MPIVELTLEVVEKDQLRNLALQEETSDEEEIDEMAVHKPLPTDLVDEIFR